MSKIPKLKSDRQVRNFWDTHSLSDYAEDLKPASIVFRKQYKEVMTIQLKGNFDSGTQRCNTKNGQLDILHWQECGT